ncbi:MAG TPA: sirohydrochlorin cobaltochelatase [Tissierellia bacterium]|nr:sirohydrochlorin cobaltochelatase [Tissierellia bacterium]
MKKGIIVTSFGTSNRETMELCIESIENRIKERYTDYLVTRAFTSRMVIHKLKKRDDYPVDTPTEALERMKRNGVKEIYIQPLLIIEGHEYEKILREVNDFVKENPDYKVTVAKPLLSHDMDYEKVVNGLGIANKDQAVVFMGHGSDHSTDLSYKKLEDTIRKAGYENVFIGTVEGEISIDDVVKKLKEKSIKKVLLKPFMLVAGVHALEDMASDSDDSWKSILEKNDIDVDLQIVGLGQVKEIQDIFIEHLDEIRGDENVY